ncbi:unnamed protein product, partial [Rotaria sp. Silwood2]
GNYIEFSSFPRPSNGPEQLRLGTSDNPPNNNSNHAIASGHLPPAKRLKVRAQADERRKNKDQIADSALTIAKKNVPKAMKYVRKKLPYEFMQRNGEDEHFYKVQPASASGTMDASIVNHRRPLIGRPDEFEITRREWLDAQNHRRAAVVSDSFDRSSAMDVEGISDESDIEIL